MNDLIRRLIKEPGSDVMTVDGHDVHISTQRAGDTIALAIDLQSVAQHDVHISTQRARDAMRVAMAIDLQSVGQRLAEVMLCTSEQALCDALENSHRIAFHIEEPFDPRTRALHHRVIDGWLVAFYTVSL